MLPISLDVALLRLQLPELVLRPGMNVVARVASRGEGTAASLVLAGALIKATVPEEIPEGATLRLAVADTSQERVIFQLVATEPPPGGSKTSQAAATPNANAPTTAANATAGFDPNAATMAAQNGVPQPQLRDADPDGQGGSEERGGPARPSVSLNYETPALGRLDLRVERGPEGVTVTVGAGAKGFFLASAREAALRQAVEAKLGVPVTVRVNPRRDPVDAYG